jgi:hypothetical protein
LRFDRFWSWGPIAYAVALGPAFLDRFLEIDLREGPKELTEHTGEPTHCRASFPVTVLVGGTATR